MTTNEFISKANALNGIYAVKHREGKRWLIEIFQRHHDDMNIDMSFAEIFVRRRILNFFVLPQPTEVSEEVSRELLRLIADYQLREDNE